MRAPLSPAQRRLWFLSRLEGASPLFNLPAALVLEGPLDPARLAAALAEVVGRQTALRTAIPERDGEPWQEVLPLPGPELARRDFSDAPDTLAAFDRIAEEEARRPFDLAAGPLCRALLCRLGPARHGLVLVVHHLVADYHAMGLVLEELAAAYARRAGDQAPPPPPPPPPRYTDYAAWRAAGDDPARTEAALRDCAELLAGAPPLLTLPGDRPRPAVASGRGGCLGFTVPAGLAQKVAELGRGQGATPFMTWLALWGLLLARLAGQEEVTVGCPVSRRRRGPRGWWAFLATAVTRLSLGGAHSWRLPGADPEHGARVLALRRPFDRLVERLAPERGLDHTPLFQAMFVLHQAPRPAPAWPGLAVSARPVANGAAEFDLNLALEPRADGALAGYLEYASDLFDPATVERWVGHLLVLAEAAVQRPDAPVGDLPLLTPAETAVLVREWSGAGSIPPAPAPPVPRGSGRRPALARGGGGGRATGRASYGELAAWAGRLAAGLGRLGIGPGTRVGVLLPPGREWVAALWGVWWAGAALVSLDPAAPARRLGDLASRAGLAALIAREGAPAGPGVLNPVDLPAAPAPEPPSPAAGDPAYLVFTSGSTGAPKGILVSNGALAFHAAAAGRALGLVPGETVLQFASPAFDVAWEELWPALLAGGRVAVCPGAARESLAAFTDFLERERVAVANLPARFWEAWTEHLAGEGRAVPAGLRLLVTGSEAVNPAALARWRELPGGDRGFLSGYGPSEATVTASFYDPARDGEHPGPALPLGRPLPGVRALVLDERGRPVPPGCLGELCLGGPGLALGYLDPADQAAGAFAPDPSGRGAPLPQRRPGRLRPPAIGRGRGSCSRRTPRPANQAPGLPHRARRDRGRPPYPRGRGRGPGGPPPRRPPGRPGGAGPRPAAGARGHAGRAGRHPAGLPAAGPDGGGPPAAASGQRQARPARRRRPGGGRWGSSGRRGAPAGDGKPPGRHLGPGVGARPDRPRGQLLPPGGGLHPGPQGGGPGRPGGPGPDAPRPLPGSHPGRAGRADPAPQGPSRPPGGGGGTHAPHPGAGLVPGTARGLPGAAGHEPAAQAGRAARARRPPGSPGGAFRPARPAQAADDAGRRLFHRPPGPRRGRPGALGGRRGRAARLPRSHSTWPGPPSAGPSWPRPTGSSFRPTSGGGPVSWG